MTAYLPDTNVLIDALNGRRGQKELLLNLVRQGHRLACCVVTISELFAGVHKADVPKVEEFVSALVWHETTLAIAKQAGRWRGEYARQGVSLALADTLIAATAVEYGLTLVTNNRKHFPMPELLLHP
jgi:predicted nucleic acid-binding protein